MFKKILILIAFAISGNIIAQNAPPNGFLYQAVVRDANGSLATNRTIYVQTAIKKATATGTTVYAEEFIIRSNADAMFSIVIGQGTNKSGTFNDISKIIWGNDKYFFNLKLCVAPSIPGTGWRPSYRDMGTTQFWSVPYSLFSEKSKSSLDSLSISSSGNTRRLKLGNYRPIFFNVADQDSSLTNEIQTIGRTGGRITLSLNGGAIFLPDSSALNELQQISRTGGRIILNQGGGIITLPDSSATNELQTINRNGGRISLSQNGGTITLPDSSSTNELQTISKTGNTVTLSNGGGSVTDADNQTLSASGTGSNKSISISGGNTININVSDADSSTTNELQTINRNGGRIALSQNGGTITLPDSSSTNELQTISKTGNTVTLSNGGGSVTDADNQILSSSGSGSNKLISISGGNSININVSDGDSSATNELQTINRNGGRIALSQNGGTITLPDSSASNELQTISKSGNTVTLSNGGGSVTDTDNQTLSASGTGSNKSISISGGNSININVSDADSSTTNELQTINRNGGRIALSQNGGTITLPDSSASNELQTISKSGNTVTLSNGGGSITDTDNQTLSASGTGSNKSISITGGNSININVSDADSSTTNELQTINRNGGRIALSQNGGTITLPDSSSINELQTISKSGNTVTLSNGGGNVTDADNQTLSSSGSGSNKSISISGGNSININVSDADSSSTNELQTINRNGGRIALSQNGGTITLPDSSASNELQTISKSGNTVTLSNGGGSITVSDNQTLTASGVGSNKSISISGGNSININVSDADSSVTNELQTINRNGGRIALSQNGGTITLPDSSATNELQTISKSGNTVTLSNGGGSVTDADNQTLSTSGSGSNKSISITGGNSININVSDGDSSILNEIQYLSKTGNVISLSNNGGSVFIDNANFQDSINRYGFNGNYNNLTNRPNLKDSTLKYSTQYLNGSINPISSVGKVGDFYINTTSYKLFGPKKSSGWVDSVSLIGPQGPAGSSGSNSNNVTISNSSTNNFSSVTGMSVPNFLNNYGNGQLGNVSVANNTTIANNSMFKNLRIASGVTALVSPSVRTVIYVSDTLFLYGTIDGSGQAGAASVSNATINHIGASATGFEFWDNQSYSSNGFSYAIQQITWEANTLPNTFNESFSGTFSNPSGQSCFSGVCWQQTNRNGGNMNASILSRFVHFGVNISGYNGSSIANTGSGAWSRNGGQGGAGLYIIAKNVVFAGEIKLNGGNGVYGANIHCCGGADTKPGISAAGGGGSCILRSQNMISQTGKFQSNGGNMVGRSGNIGVVAGNGAMLIIK